MKNRKSRVKGDFQARFCGKAGVKFPRLTRLSVSVENQNIDNAIRKKAKFETKLIL
jgi:hypothetical protein